MVMSGIFEKVKQMPMSKWLNIIDVVLPNITTDISNKEIISLATNIVTMGTTEINQYRIPVEGYYSDGTSTTDGRVLILDLEGNKELLQKFIYDYDGETEEVTTESAGEQ
jgi:anionic cell wall polymer biosynthesis LytR-Cps2A-Psr (LCP) family protein